MRKSWLIALSLAWAAVLVLIFGRFLSLLLGANPQSNLIEQAYTYSEFCLRPFFGLLGLTNRQRESGGVFELASVVAFGVYFAAGGLIFALARSALAGRLARAAFAPPALPAEPEPPELVAEAAEPAAVEPRL